MSLLTAGRIVTRLTKSKYVKKKAELIGEWRSTRVWFAPDRGDIEYVILMLMGRSRRRLSKSIEQFKCGSKVFTEYRFGNQVAIHIEQVGSDLTVVRFHNVDRWMRFHIMRELLFQEKKLVYTIETYVEKLDSLWIVSRLWFNFVVEEVETSVGRWMVVQPAMKRLMRYRAAHSTRDDLHSVGAQELLML